MEPLALSARALLVEARKLYPSRYDPD